MTLPNSTTLHSSQQSVPPVETPGGTSSIPDGPSTFRPMKPLPFREATNTRTRARTKINTGTITDASSQAQKSTPRNARVDVSTISCAKGPADVQEEEDEQASSKRRRTASSTTDPSDTPQPQVSQEKERDIIIVGGDDAISRTVVITLASVIPPTSILQWNFKPSSRTAFTRSSPSPSSFSSTSSFSSSFSLFPASSYLYSDLPSNADKSVATAASVALTTLKNKQRIAQWARFGSLAKAAAQGALVAQPQPQPQPQSPAQSQPHSQSQSQSQFQPQARTQSQSQEGRKESSAVPHRSTSLAIVSIVAALELEVSESPYWTRSKYPLELDSESSEEEDEP